MKEEEGKLVVYPAASLFSARETFFTAHLVSKLEKEKGYVARLPQRDGFEFGNLTNSLEDKLSPEEISSAVQDVIYFLDMGIFVPQSDVIIANLDEPIDEGVVVEISYARFMGKCVIGYRTDIRSPYGDISDALKGMHFFPAYQCNFFISHHMPSKNISEANSQMQDLVEKIDAVIQSAGILPETPIPKNSLLNPQISNLLKAVTILFEGIKDIHSKQGLEEIAQRYQNHKNELRKLRPVIL